ncbi:MAG: AAA family ATPase [Chitinophagaceae bacterium]
MSLQGPSGSGKTFSALLIAYGLCRSWEHIAVIDTENHSADLYAHLGAYQVLSITAPFSPEKYSEALQICINAGMEVVIIDSVSHEWEGSGGILDIHGRMQGNSFTNWAHVTPRHNAFVQAILQSPVHVIGTIRSKQDYVLSERNGKMVPEKVGMKGVTKEGMDYEFTLVLDMNIKHFATASKDRTSLFIDKPEFKPSEETGITILNWCNEGVLSIEEQICNCPSEEALVELRNQNPQYHESHNAHFVNRRTQLRNQAVPNPTITSNLQTTPSSNGIHNS